MSEPGGVGPAEHTSLRGRFPGRRLGFPNLNVLDVSAVLPGALVLVVVLLWSAKDGGFAPTTWLPGALFLLGVLLVVVVATRMDFGGRLVVAAVALFAAFTVWNYLSILWAQERGPAWDGSNRTFLYFCVFTIVAARRWSARATGVAMGIFVLGVGVIGGIYVQRATGDGDPGRYFLEGRLASPIGYANGNAALMLTAFWPAVLLASRRSVPVVVRGLMLAAAGLLLEAALLCQSRASLIAVPVTAAVYLLVVPQRLRAALTFVCAAAVTAIAGGALTNVYSVLINGGDGATALPAAEHAVGRSVVALFFVGVLIALVDRAVQIPARVVRVIGIALLVVGVAGAGTASAAAVSKYGDPVDRLREGWQHFKSDRRDDYGQTHLLSGLGSNRYDLWRVAALEFSRHPVAGIGSDNYAAAYIRERRSGEEPSYPHSLPLRVLSQTGIVGTLLFSGLLGCSVIAWWRTRRRSSAGERAAAAAAGMVFVYWFVHGSVDWLFELPALGAAAFAALALVVRTGPGEEPVASAPAGARPWWLAVGAAAVAVLAAGSLGAPWVSAKEIQLAGREWTNDPSRAYDRLDVARRFNPLSEEADVTAGVIAGKLGDLPRQKRAFERVLQRNDLNWYAYFELGVIDGVERRRASALGWLRQAARLNPTEPLIKEVSDGIRRGETIDTRAIDSEFADRAAILQKHPGQTPNR